MSEEGKVFRIRLDDQHLKEDIAVMFEGLKQATETSKMSVREAIREMTFELDIKIKQAIAIAERAVKSALMYTASSLRTITDVVQNYNILFGQQIETQFAAQISGAISTIAYLQAQMAAAALSPLTWAAVPAYAAVILSLFDILAQIKLANDRIQADLKKDRDAQFQALLQEIS